MNSKCVGEVSEAIVLAHFIKKGWSVSIPFGDNQRYDMIVDDGEGLIRVQCKTGRLVRGCIEFATSSKNGFTGERTAYDDSVDAFAVYAPHTQRVYMIKASDARQTFTTLRLEPSRIAYPGIRYAKDYEI